MLKADGFQSSDKVIKLLLLRMDRLFKLLKAFIRARKGRLYRDRTAKELLAVLVLLPHLVGSDLFGFIVLSAVMFDLLLSIYF